MKSLCFLLALWLFCGQLVSAQPDSLAVVADPPPTVDSLSEISGNGATAGVDTLAASSVAIRRIDRHTSTKLYRMTFVSMPLIIGGVVMMSYDKDFRNLRNSYASSFVQRYDDYLQYAPMGLTYALKACGYQSRSSWGRMVVSNIFSAGLMAGAVNTLKYTVSVQRPDGSSFNSFPSGHTATAFMAATILHKEYGRRSPWFSVAGYTMATVVGITRQLNNRHWMSDVMVGAGIGILSAELGYLLADLIYKDRGLNDPSEQIYVFDRYRHPSFFGLNVGFSTILGDYAPFAGTDVRFTTGPTVSIQGAWFASPYFGVGGRLTASNMHVELDHVAQNEKFCSAGAYAGLYLSYPISARWLLGSKLLGGYEYYKSADLEGISLGETGGGAFGTGVSMFYAANRSLGVRFTTDYDLIPPMTRQSGERMHRLTFGMEVCAVF